MSEQQIGYLDFEKFSIFHGRNEMQLELIVFIWNTKKKLIREMDIVSVFMVLVLSFMISMSPHCTNAAVDFNEWFQQLDSDLHTIYRHSAEFAWNLRWVVCIHNSWSEAPWNGK